MATEQYPNGNFQPEPNRPYRPGTHWLMEYASPQALASARQENIDMLVAHYATGCDTLREDVLRKLQHHTGSTDGLSWAMFALGEEQSSRDTLVMEPPVMVFVYTQRYPGDRKVAGQAVPFMRIITNEQITAENGRNSVLCKDFSLLADNSAFYNVGAVSEFSAADTQAVPEIEIIVPGTRYGRHDAVTTDWQSLAAEVSIDADAKIQIRPTVEKVTPLMSVADYREIEVTPFGDNTSFEDYTYALAQGSKLFELVTHLEPMLARHQ